MTSQKHFADKVRDRATDDPYHAHRASYRRRRTDVVEHFRPALGVPTMPIPRPGSYPESCERRGA